MRLLPAVHPYAVSRRSLWALLRQQGSETFSLCVLPCIGYPELCLSSQVAAEAIWFSRKNPDSLETSAASGGPSSPGRTKKGKKSPKKRNSGGSSTAVKIEPNTTPLPSTPVPEISAANLVCDEKEKMEVWFHESCVIWAPGVCLVPPRLVGLDEAIADSHQAVCCVYVAL